MTKLEIGETVTACASTTKAGPSQSVELSMRGRRRQRRSSCSSKTKSKQPTANSLCASKIRDSGLFQKSNLPAHIEKNNEPQEQTNEKISVTRDSRGFSSRLKDIKTFIQRETNKWIKALKGRGRCGRNCCNRRFSKETDNSSSNSNNEEEQRHKVTSPRKKRSPPRNSSRKRDRNHNRNRNRNRKTTKSPKPTASTSISSLTARLPFVLTLKLSSKGRPGIGSEQLDSSSPKPQSPANNTRGVVQSRKSRHKKIVLDQNENEDYDDNDSTDTNATGTNGRERTKQTNPASALVLIATTTTTTAPPPPPLPLHNNWSSSDSEDWSYASDDRLFYSPGKDKAATTTTSLPTPPPPHNGRSSASDDWLYSASKTDKAQSLLFSNRSCPTKLLDLPSTRSCLTNLIEPGDLMTMHGFKNFPERNGATVEVVRRSSLGASGYKNECGSNSKLSRKWWDVRLLSNKDGSSDSHKVVSVATKHLTHFV
eukprot:CAMPEP_0168245270 /NCGR_PEP_ID=MMETSP0140_2-20121125/25075_1 /TAXON_ID=44445 /ORGANISM="Pseudo-nitzschia australis, Strain 10249 10 AB" /LENGTH=481 /DNA_ID=CAMNT_0008180849 /DNA_START=45 /DNA_END=1490 /DNA_ORIENTATION=+